jgi:hypothetical protein
MAFKHISFILGATVLAGTACSSHKEYTRADTTASTNPSPSTSGSTGTAASDTITREKDALISQSDGSQLGTLRDYSGTSLTVDNEAAGPSGSLTMRADNSVPVFQGQQKVSTDALVPGSDVRVFYRTPADGTQPQAVAIEILNPNQDSSLPGSQDGTHTTTPGSQDKSGTTNPGSQDQGRWNDDSMGNSPDTPNPGSMDDDTGAE